MPVIRLNMTCPKGHQVTMKVYWVKLFPGTKVGVCGQCGADLIYKEDHERLQELSHDGGG